MRELVIVGAGGHGRELLDVVEAVNRVSPTWAFLGFLDDGPVDEERLARRGARHLGAVSELSAIDTDYVVGIGDSTVRERIAAFARELGRDAAVLVHPAASVGGDTVLSPGTVLCAGARVTTNVRLGQHVHLNVNAVVSHEGRVGDFVTLSPGVLVNGTVALHDHVFLGTGAVVTPGLTIGAGTWVGAGAVVVTSLPGGVVATGVPARVRRGR